MSNTENTQLKLIRKTLGYNQADFAKSIGLTQGGYSDIERGKNGLSSKVKLMLINIHKINISFLERNKGEMFYIETPLDQDEVEKSTINPSETLDTRDRQIELLLADITRLKSEKALYLDIITAKEEIITSKDKTISFLESQLQSRR